MHTIGQIVSNFSPTERVLLGGTLGTLLAIGYNKYEKDNPLLEKELIEERDRRKMLMGALGGAGVGLLSEIFI